jgi:SAM-dependent methyltransferase
MPKLPSFWKRISRPEIERGTGKELSERHWARLAKKDLLGRQTWPINGTTLENIEWNLGYSFIEEISKRLSSGKKQVRVLDAGCGVGTTLNNLKQKFGNSVRTVGLTLQKTPGESYSGVDRIIEDRIERVEPKESFDIIFSYSGAHFHSKQKLAAIQRTISLLKVGGDAVIDLATNNLGSGVPERHEIKTLLRANGITQWNLRKVGQGKPVVLTFTKPKIKLPR